MPTPRSSRASAGSFEADLARFVLLATGRTAAFIADAGAELQRSVVEGSELTGAPGQPVDTGFLKASWIGTPRGDGYDLRTNCAYAPVIEYNDRAFYDDRGVTGGPRIEGRGQAGGAIRSTVGGHHSVAMTVAAWPRIVEVVQARIRRGGR